MLDINEIMNSVMPDLSFGSSNGWHGMISEEQVMQSVHDTCEFFGMPDPALTTAGPATGVYTNLDFTPADDVLLYNADELNMLGVTGKDGLDLVMTHECAHRELQDMMTGFNAHQEELCCDFMVGVRAGLNDIDVSSLQNALGGMEETFTHPDGQLRIEAVEQGMEYAKEFLSIHGEAPTFNDCYEQFCSDTMAQLGNEFSGFVTSEEISNQVQELSQQALERELDGEEIIMRHYKNVMEAHAETGELTPSDIDKYEEALHRYESIRDEYDINSELSFKGGPKFDREYYEKGAANDTKLAKQAEERAARALAEGNEFLYNSHMRTAKIYHDSAAKKLELASKCTK